MKRESLVILLFALLLLSRCTDSKEKITISADLNSPQMSFAVQEIQSAFDTETEIKVTENEDADIILSIDLKNESLSEEGFSLTKSRLQPLLCSDIEEPILISTGYIQIILSYCQNL